MNEQLKKQIVKNSPKPAPVYEAKPKAKTRQFWALGALIVLLYIIAGIVFLGGFFMGIMYPSALVSYWLGFSFASVAILALAEILEIIMLIGRYVSK